MIRKIVPLLLLFVVLSAGCLGHEETKTNFSIKINAVPFNPGINVTAVMFHVHAKFIGYKHVTVNYSYPAILIKTSPDVLNLSAFKLSDDVYMLPYYSFKNPENLASILVRMKNGSTTSVDIRVEGTPKKSIEMTINYEVKKNGMHYLVRPIGWSVKKLTVWNETFNVTLVIQRPIQIANAPTVELKNDTYLLPELCKTKSGSVTAIYKYSVGDVYVIGPAGEGFVGKVYFPCEKMAGK